MPKPSVLVPLALVALVLVALPLQAVMELPGEKALKTALGVDYPKTCEDYETVGKGEEGTWREEPPLPSVRDEPRAVRIGDVAFLAGGVVEGGEDTRSVDTFELFDFKTRSYRTLPRLPQALNHVGIAAHDGDVYIAGGFTGGVNDPVSQDQLWRYRVEEREWESLQPMPTRRAGHGLVVLDGRMYAVGGRIEDGGHTGRSLAAVDVYDFAEDEWSQASPMSLARDHLGVTVHDGEIYALGGRPGRSDAYRRFERYDTSSGEWERLRDYPLPASGIELESVAGRLVAAGGEDPGRERLIGEAWACDPGADRWQRLPAMSKPKHGYGSVVADGRFWAFGGAECYGFQPASSVDSLSVGPHL